MNDERKELAKAMAAAQQASARIDQEGLHTAARRGYINLITDLIKKGAYVDYPSPESGKTPLHYGVANNRIDVVELLLYLGADVNIRDKAGMTPNEYCRSNEMRVVLDKVIKQVAGNGAGAVKVDCADIRRGCKAELRNIGVSVDYPRDRGSTTKTFIYTCRRQQAEFNDANSSVAKDEEVCSDFFVHRVADNTGKVESNLTIPLFGPPSQGEDLVVKTDTGKELAVKGVSKKGAGWYCTVKEDLTQFSSFVVVGRKKKEVFKVGKAATKLVSAVDKRVEIDIPANAFETPTNLTMEISEPPEEEELDTEEIEDIASFTAFYSIDAGGKMPIKPVNVKLPLSANYQGKKDLVVVMTMAEDEEDEDEECWDILDIDKNIEGNQISFELASFSVKVAIETKSMMAGQAEEGELKKQVSHLYRASRRRIHYVVFLGMVMPIGNTGTFKIVVECCQESQATDRKQHWEREGFEDQRPSITAAFTAHSKQTYSVTLSDTLRILGHHSEIILEFHPKRQNYQVFTAEVADPASQGIGHVQIEAVIPVSSPTKDAVDVKDRGSFLSNIVVHLKGRELTTAPSFNWGEPDDVFFPEDRDSVMSLVTVRSDDQETERSSVRRLSSTDDSGDSFLNKQRLFDLLEDCYHDWFKIYIFIGITFRQIDKRLCDRAAGGHELNELLEKWIRKADSREDRGVRVLLSALRSAGRMDLRTQLLVQMRSWYEAQGQSTNTFYQWVKSAYKDPEVLDPSGYPRPMSDQYLLLLASVILPSLELAIGLTVSKWQLDDVMSNGLYNNDVMKVMKLFEVMRERWHDEVESLDKLLGGLSAEHLSGARNYAVMLGKAWVKRSAFKDDLLVQRLGAVLEKYN